MMNGEGPSVPITTLAGIQSITELLLELPLPSALPGASAPRSLLPPQQADEARRALAAPPDPRMLPSLLEALSRVGGADHVDLKDGGEGATPHQGSSPLLQLLVARGVFKGPPPWQQQAAPPVAQPRGYSPSQLCSPAEGVSLDGSPGGLFPATPFTPHPPSASLHDHSVAGILDGAPFSPVPKGGPPTPSFCSNGNCAPTRTGMALCASPQQQQQQLQHQTTAPLPCQQPPVQCGAVQSVASPASLGHVNSVAAPPAVAKTPIMREVSVVLTREKLVPNNVDATRGSQGRRAEPRQSPQKETHKAPAANKKKVVRNSIRENSRRLSSSDEEDGHAVRRRLPGRKSRDSVDGKTKATGDRRNSHRSPREEKSSMDLYASSLSERVKNRRRTHQKAKYKESPVHSHQSGSEHSAFELEEEPSREKAPPMREKPKAKPKKMKKEPAPAPLSAEELMESNTYQRFSRTVEAIFDSMEDLDLTQELDDEVGCPPEALVPAPLLRDLCNEAAKLKILQATNQVPPERLVRLLSILERNVVDGAKICPMEHEDQEDDEGRLWAELSMERITRSADASLTALYIMTAPHMPKRVFLEDLIERIVGFAKFQIQNTVYPAFDPVYRVDSRSKEGYVGSARQKRAHAPQKVRERSVLQLYNKLHELVGLLAELLGLQTLTDTVILQVSTLGVGPFFVEGVSELQLHALRLVTTIFAHYDKHRQLILEDILASIARLPTSKRSLRNYRLNSEEHIQMLTALVLQLIHSVVKLPEGAPPTRDEAAAGAQPTTTAVDTDVLIVTSYDAAVHTAANFLSVFLRKCGTKTEEMDYRPVFENFVQDLLSTVNKPEWPASELILSLLGRLLVQNFSNKSLDMPLRVASLDYLGVVAARLRKDAVTSQIKKETIDDILRQIEEDEEDDLPLTSLSRSKGRSVPKAKDETQLLQRALLHYLDTNLDSDPSLQFSRRFYVAQWYRDAMAEAKAKKPKDQKEPKEEVPKPQKVTNSRTCRNKSSKRNCEEEEEEEEDKPATAQEANEEEQSKKAALVEERKKFLLHMAKPAEAGGSLKSDQGTLDYATAELISRFLASRRPFSQSFDVYLTQILRVLSESAVAVRTKAMKCLTLVVEADPSILGRPDMRQGVHGRLLDHSTSVREAAVDLVGKFILVRPELTHKYYDMLTERILDTGVSVRKRVIKILKDVCLEQPGFEKIPEICVKIIGRVNDEEGIKKLVGEVFQSMWFTPQESEERLLQKVRHITHVVAACREMGLDWFEQLLGSLLKDREDGQRRGVLESCRQIVDCLVERVLCLEEGGGGSSHLVACLSTLYLFSRIRPQLLVRHAQTIQPYLSMRLAGPQDYQVLHNVTRCLELVVPLMEHPSEAFLAQVEEDLAKQLIRHALAILPASVSCLSAVVNQVTHNYPLVRDMFHKFFMLLCHLRREHQEGRPIAKPSLQRSLYTLGLLCRHFDIEHLEMAPGATEDAAAAAAAAEEGPLKQRVFGAMLYFTEHAEEEIRLRALTGLGFMLVRQHDLMLGPEVRELYRHLLESPLAAPVARVQVLKNLTAYLMEEEAKMIRRDAEWNKLSKGENLKEMGDVSSGMASTVVQVYLKHILASAANPALAVRRAALQVLQLVLGQGLVHPVQMVPHLACLGSDDDKPLRNKADQLLQELEKKYPGFVQMKALAGVRLSFDMHRGATQRGQGPVRGFRSADETPTSRNGFLYAVLRTTRQSRRAFLLSLLKLFDEQARAPLAELLYAADNLVYFPYQVQDEPLFVMHHIDVLLSVAGSNLLQSFREALLPRDGERAAIPEEEEDDDDDLESLVARVPEDLTPLEESMQAAQGCILLLFVKQTLKDTYGFTDSRIQQYSPNEAAKTYERPLNRRSGVRFRPEPTLQALQAEDGERPNGEDLVQRYLDFKQLMLTIDPDDDDDDEGQPKPVAAVASATVVVGGADANNATVPDVATTTTTTVVTAPAVTTPVAATALPRQRLSAAPAGVTTSRGRPPGRTPSKGLAAALRGVAASAEKVKKKPRKKRKRVICSDGSSDNEDSDPSFCGD
ncbi:unnamed protein product [Ixodes hexagonus]